MAPLSSKSLVGLGVVIGLTLASVLYITSILKQLDNHTTNIDVQEKTFLLEQSLEEERRKVQKLQEKILQLNQQSNVENENPTFTKNNDVASTSAINNSTTMLPLDVIDEYIPPQFQMIYKHAKNYIPPFNVTRSMLRQSRPVVGNVERLHAYIRKLQSKQCTTVLILGGSITDGRRVIDGKNGAYSFNFVASLSFMYPCITTNGKKGMHKLKTTHASTSQMQFTSRSTIEGIDQFDLVILEYNVNDGYIADLPHALEDKGTYGKLREYASLWYFEVLLRRLLLLRKPDPPAIVTFNAGYFGKNWEGHPEYSKGKARTNSLYRNNEDPNKIWLSSLYGIPVFSTSSFLLPLAGRMGKYQQFSKNYIYSTKNWHADPCCHPPQQGHTILTLVLMYNIVEEEKLMDSLYKYEADMLDVQDPTTYNPPILRDPIYLSTKEDTMYVRADTNSSSGLDFTDPNGEDFFKDYIVANEGWSWHCDDKGKCGISADGTGGGQHIVISLNGTEHGIVEVKYIVSYENFGVATAWLGEETKEQVELWCNKKVERPFLKPSGIRPHHMTAIWNEAASVPKVDLLRERLNKSESKALHICLTPKNSHLAGKENRFKLLGVRVY